VEPQSTFEKNTAGSAKPCIAAWLGCIEYSEALDFQMRICDLKRAGFDKDVLLLLEHPPTITLGRNARLSHLLVADYELASRGVTLKQVDRGGDITFHGPGQLVGYPILLLEPGERDIRRYMRNLELSLIRLLDGFGIEGLQDARYTGVWTSEGKIGAMGVHISRWITRHGFALNVNTDLSFYDLIVPCGIVGRGVTSMGRLLDRTIDLHELAEKYVYEFGIVFNRTMIMMGDQALRQELFDHSPQTRGNGTAFLACKRNSI